MISSRCADHWPLLKYSFSLTEATSEEHDPSFQSRPPPPTACECAILGINVGKHLHDGLAEVVSKSNIVVCVELDAEGVTCPLNNPSHMDTGPEPFSGSTLRKLGTKPVYE
jgi:hypothetical protein